MLWLEAPARLAIIVPTVAVPIVSWLGVGSLISVLHPVSVQPLFRRRWGRRCCGLASGGCGSDEESDVYGFSPRPRVRGSWNSG